MSDWTPVRRFDWESFSAAEVATVGLRGLSLKFSHQHKMVGSIVAGVFNVDGSKAAAIGA